MFIASCLCLQPGGGSKYFDFKKSQYGDGTNNMKAIWNTPIGQENTFEGPELPNHATLLCPDQSEATSRV